MSFVIAKQPIYDRGGNVFGYEVYLRSKNSSEKYPSEVPFSKAAYIVTDILVEYGIDRVSEGKKVILNVSLESLLNKSLEILPKDRVVFDLNPSEVPIGDTIYKKILEKIKDFKSKGSMFILNQSLYTSKYKDLINLSNIVEFYMKDVKREKVTGVKKYSKEVLISRIETDKEYRKAKELDADYFEGNYFSPPVVVKNAEIVPFLKVTLLRLMSSLSNAKSLKQIAEIISSDVGMAVKFLQFVNSAYFLRRKKIEDIQHAVSYIGLENLKKFVLLVALNEYLKLEKPQLWKKSLIRAHIAEELTKRHSPHLSEKAFLVGLFSLLDEILGVDIPSFLKDLNIDEEVVKAFTGENSSFKKILEISAQLEEAVNRDPEELDKVVSEISIGTNIPEIELVIITKEAKERAEKLIRI
ncbi:MAG TPA: HDOD domain-containing protein [Aquifex aeolicus]|nr:HDOD domain-containing protein [Aquifex aeolicus]